MGVDEGPRSWPCRVQARRDGSFMGSGMMRAPNGHQLSVAALDEGKAAVVKGSKRGRG